jgi:hypothetical protein
MFSSFWLVLFWVRLLGLFCFFRLAWRLSSYGRNNSLKKIKRQCIGGKAAISPLQLALAVFEKFLLKAQHMYG